MSNPINQWASRKTDLLTVGSLQFTNSSILTVDDLVMPGARASAGMALMTMSLWDTSDVTFMYELTSAVLYFHPQRPELSSYPGYFQEPHWQPIGLPEISRVTWQPMGLLEISRETWQCCETVLSSVLPLQQSPMSHGILKTALHWLRKNTC